MLSKETLKRIEKTLDEMFDDLVDRNPKFDRSYVFETPGSTPKNLKPKFPLNSKPEIPINIYDNDEKSVIVALVPGELKSNVKVELSDDLDAIEITVSNSDESTTNAELKHYEFNDRRAMTAKKYTHKRSVQITKDYAYALDKITSHLEFGILYITLPKLKSVKKDKPVIQVK